MRFKDFDIILEAEKLGYYAVGDETASSFGNGWTVKSTPGATSTSGAVRSALESIPSGSVVAICVGLHDAEGPANPIRIANQIDSLVGMAKSKGLQPVYIMFPGENSTRTQSVKDAIGESIGVPVFNPGSSAAIMASFKPAPPQKSIATNKAPTARGSMPTDTKANVSGSFPAFKEPGFKDALEKTASNLGVNPNHLIAIMKQESGLRPQAVNKTSGATGLIQFMPSTAAKLGTSTKALYNMSATEQMPWVEKYLRGAGVKPGMDLGDLYIAVFYPAALGQGNGHVISKQGNAVYNQNKGLDTNKDGVLTVADVKNSVSRYA